jgi:putative two-component system response regulator
VAVDRFKDADPETEWNRESNCGNDIKETKQLHMDTTNWKSELAAYAKMKILIVDDEPANVALLEDMLGEQGYTHLKSTTDSRRVLELCHEFDPDLILLDLFMPHLDGFAVLESLRADRSEVYLPIIVLTADVNEDTKRRALHCGATDFLNKPLDHIEVLLRIRNLLETRRIHQLLDNRRAALEDSVHARTSELQAAQAALERVRGKITTE